MPNPFVKLWKYLTASANAQMLAILGDVQQPPPDLGPVTAASAANAAAVADLQALAALDDTPDNPSPDAPALTALLWEG